MPRSLILSVKSPLLSLVTFILGHGLLTTLLTIRLSLEHVSAQWIGFISTAYFAGLILGSFINIPLILRIGHIRAYAAYASLLATLCLLHGFFIDPLIWSVLRLIGGIATGGLFVVIESWMLVSSNPANRGNLMAIYMVLLYGALAVGQLLLKYVDPMLLTPFALSAMAASLSVIPLSLTRVGNPKLDAPQRISFLALIRQTPAGMGCCFISGLVLGALYGLLPLFFSMNGFSLDQVANLMAVVIMGGVCLQYPIGRYSDHHDRRLILQALAVSLTIVCIAILLMPEDRPEWVMGGLIFLFGGLAFSIYPVSVSHACDELTPNQVVSANQGLMLSYSIGAMVGPLIAPTLIRFTPQNGLFIYFAGCGLVMGGYLLWRRKMRTPVPLSEHQAYTPIPPNTLVSAELDPRQHAEQPPASES